MRKEHDIRWLKSRRAPVRIGCFPGLYSGRDGPEEPAQDLFQARPEIPAPEKFAQTVFLVDFIQTDPL
jgi:hypothetical protein